jgi:hypothetical protein
MDFPYFTRPRVFGSTSPLPIPLITIITHQPLAGPFIDFPKQLGFNFKADPAGCLDIDPHSASEVTVLLQSWLFFGLLVEFLGTSVNLEAFILPPNNGEGQTIDLTVLEKLLVEWNDRMQNMQAPARAQRAERI